MRRVWIPVALVAVLPACGDGGGGGGALTLPVISAVTPVEAGVGDLIQVAGSGFGLSGALSIGGTQAIIVDWSDSRIRANVPAGADNGVVHVIAPGGTSAPAKFEFLWTGGNPVNVQICSIGGYNSSVLSDGAGGAIFVWEDNRSGNMDVYAQRVNAAGEPLWAVDGVPIAKGTHQERQPKVVSDGQGGAIIAWMDGRTAAQFDIYAQRVNESGTLLWTAGGAAVSTFAADQEFPVLASDGAGGAVIAWTDERGSMSTRVFAQRMNAVGSALWMSDGLAVCMASNAQAAPRLVGDGTGGVIVTWSDGRAGNSDIYAQRIDGSGTPRWPTDGVVVSAAANPQKGARSVKDGNDGVIVVWEDMRSGLEDLYAQRLNADGVAQWAVNGVPLTVSGGTQYLAQIATDGVGGAIIVWQDENGGPEANIMAQRVAASGATQWTANGISIATATGYQRFPQIVPDGAGGAVIGWEDNRSGSFDICAQRVSGAGILLWSPDPTVVCSAANPQTVVAMAENGSGGAIFLWQDERGAVGFSDLYAQGLSSTGQ